MDLINLYRQQKAELPLCLGPDDCREKTYIVTGSNIGLGYECAKHLVSFQARRVILAVRSLERGRAAVGAIESETGRLGVADVWPLDLSSYDSIKTFVRKVENELDQVDALVANAAGASSEWTLSESIETTITVNLVGTLFMSVLMLPYLKDKAKTTSTVPIITVVTSDLAFGRRVDLSKINKEEILNDLSNDRKWSIDGTNRYSFPASPLWKKQAA
jgi:NAD(P)-dependent dehydrogenase (short-subunit alcohol dehydrogenase family)